MKVKVISLPYILQVLYVLCFARPKYQVSVYRTIGPLVFSLKPNADTALCCSSVGSMSLVKTIYNVTIMVNDGFEMTEKVLKGLKPLT